jgi:hypothetical protein
MTNNSSDVKQESALLESTGTTTKTQLSDKKSALDLELRRSITNSGNESGEKVRDPSDIMKDLFSLENDNKLKLRTENLPEKEDDNSDLMIKMMLFAGLAFIAAASGGAGIAALAGGAAMAPILPKILEMGKEFLLGKDLKDGNQQTISQDSLEKDFPKKMLALSLFEFAESGKSTTADLIFNNENPVTEKIKNYTNSLSTMNPEQRTAELNSLRDEVTKIALASTQPNLSEKIDKVFLGLNEVLEGRNSGIKEGEDNFLSELKKNLSVRGIINNDGSVTIMENETSKKEGKKGEEGKEGEEGKKGEEGKVGEEGKEVPSPAPASRGEENKSAPRAEPIKGLEESKSASGGR